MQTYGVKVNTRYEKNIRINSGDKRIEVIKRPYVLAVSKDKDGNIKVSKKYIDGQVKRVVKTI